MAKIRLTKKSFIAWLETKEPMEAVGSPNASRHCPLACFLNETKDRVSENVSVGALSYTIGRRTNRLPGWAERFVCNVDHTPRIGKRYSYTAEEALQIIKSI